MSESSLEGRGVMRAAWVPMVRVEGTGGAWGVGTRPAILSGGHYLDQGYDIQVEKSLLFKESKRSLQSILTERYTHPRLRRSAVGVAPGDNSGVPSTANLYYKNGFVQIT